MWTFKHTWYEMCLDAGSGIVYNRINSQNKTNIFKSAKSTCVLICIATIMILFHHTQSHIYIYVCIQRIFALQPPASLCDQGQLREAIRDMVLRCPQTLFIFDEAEKLHPGLIDAIKPYMDHYDNVDGVSYRRAIFLFLRLVLHTDASCDS